MRNFLLLVFLTILCGCAKNTDITSSKLGDFKILASIESAANSKVTISDLAVKWDNNDCLYIFQVDNNGSFLSEKITLTIDSGSISSDGLSANFYGDKPTDGVSYIVTSLSEIRVCETNSSLLTVDNLLSNLTLSTIEDNWILMASPFSLDDDDEVALDFSSYQSQITFNLKMADGVEDVELSQISISMNSTYVTSTLFFDTDAVAYVPDTTYYGSLLRSVDGSLTLTDDSYFTYCESVPLINNYEDIKDYIVTYEITTSDGRSSSVSLSAEILQPNSFHNQDLIFPEPTYPYSGAVTQLKKATKGNNTDGVNFIIMGDGFTESSMSNGGTYDQRMNAALTAITDIEPFKTYSDYINVYSVDVISESSGFNSVEMALGSTFGDGTSITGDYDEVIGYASLVGVDLTTAVIAVVINSSKYAGTCASYSNGTAIGYVPYVSNSYAAFSKVFHHEVLGHGFGKFLDEYIDYEESITDEYITSFNNSRAVFKMGYNMTLDLNDLPWAHFMDLDDYSEVDNYEGGFFFSKGVWRSEYNSCMNDNSSYFSAVCREQIVQRIMDLAGEEYDFNDFMEKDLASGVQATATKSIGSSYVVDPDFVPLAPPILIKVD